MITPAAFFDALHARGIQFYTGVPDSLLADFCAYVDEHLAASQHVIAANEGNAVALAMGYHLANGQVAAVYMQNSGLGNAVNPLASLADPEVYKVPMLLIVGWRGEPGDKDEPQHVKQGRITCQLLDTLEIPYQLLDADADLDQVLDRAAAELQRRNAPVALVVRKNTFSKYPASGQDAPLSQMQREPALRQLLDLMRVDDLVVSTTGKTSRELSELRAARGEAQRDFLTVGGMGHTASIALGVCIGQPKRRVVCLDGDGSLLMHMGALPVIAGVAPRNLVHVLLNNASHDSVGGQATVAGHVNFQRLAEAVGYSGYACAHDADSLEKAWTQVTALPGPTLLEIRLMSGSRADLGRPKTSAEQNKRAFMAAASG